MIIQLLTTGIEPGLRGERHITTLSATFHLIHFMLVLLVYQVCVL